ncbi:LLM class F420-dependent oxidoreductase [Cryptosporangium aurantiacum]|uniref:Probable F420-dependent oxidoreductase, Rv2161c family n=1 Tax=Cryptosporangium aurantiacum TaxID=134849 RepID=A0A1M7PL90_9ACTN|nr:LLM class F420-dependent oxidoreductase [Cryptosporangium aurantiacum]SHN17784.1 probable F420-dependent oxidoreductase, Rv2161c family [Cryptosporangium aurantiacum]
MHFTLMFPMRAVKHYERWRGDADLSTVARLVEDAGFDAIAMSDHPYPDKTWLAGGGHHSFDPFVSLSYMAAVTTRLRVMTYVLVGGYRNPYLAAKAIASLDTLSRGRTIVGMGAGYLESEFDVLGADFAGRGPTLEAAIPAMRAAWTGTDHPGPRFAATGHEMLPAAVQQGGPPIWIGGNSAAARRRAVELADGWIPMGQSREVAEITGTPPLEDVAKLGVQIADAQKRRAALGREPMDVGFAPFEQAGLVRGTMTDYAESVRRRLDAYAEAGVTWITVEPTSRSLEDFRRDLGVVSELLLDPARGSTA